MIDTHIHLDDSEFDIDIEEVVKRAKDAGVTKCIVPAVDFKGLDQLIRRCLNYPDFAFPAIGLHPTSVGKNWQRELVDLTDALLKHDFYAIGEIGIDGHWSRDFIEEQKDAFRAQIVFAISTDLPIIIHSREAWEEIFEVFDEFVEDKIKLPSGVFHAFSGSYEIYERILTYGDFKFGIGGVVTYKNASLAKTLAKIPLSDIVLETDAPWLTPTKFRGKRNESSYLCFIVEKIAEIKNCSIKEVADITTLNALKLFGLN